MDGLDRSWPHLNSACPSSHRRYEEPVFHGHVLGAEGLERRVVVLAVNEREATERSRERLYIGLSRARDQLVVCGDPDYLEQVGGTALMRALAEG